MKRIIFALALMSLLWSCKKESSSPEYNSQPVIEGYLYAGGTPNVKVTRQFANSSGTSDGGQAVDTLNMKISCGSAIYTLVNIGDGVYIDSSLVFEEGQTYTLSFMYEGVEVSASTAIPTQIVNYSQSDSEISVQKIDANTVFTPGMGGGFTPGDPIELTWSNSDNSYYMVLVQNLEASPELIRDTSDDRFPSVVFRNEPSITSSYEIREQQFLYFGRHALILYHINQEYATLYDDNSTSSQNLTNPSTSIKNGYGIFTGLIADTLYFQVKKSN